MPQRQLIFSLLLIFTLFSSCVPGFRPDPVLLRLPRPVVVRERGLLVRRMNRLRTRIRWFENRRTDDEGEHLRFRLRRMRRVRFLLSRKLRNYEGDIPFSREEWRLAHNAGCRMYR